MASHFFTRTLGMLCVTSGLLALSACGPTSVYRPFFDEGGSGASIDEYTYVSRPYEAKTVTIVDTRTDEVVWSLDVPVGQQLSINFDDKSKNQDKYMSGEMRWGVQAAGNRFGTLRNRLDVPPPHSRRIDVDIRQGPEVATAPPGSGN
ncbi:MAG: hypothetical protein HND58_17080 [Planctomycetota bacterium]|nr:MAG: hypothetical protein HND58_17080 [Planctomycetota bacterium]